MNSIPTAYGYVDFLREEDGDLVVAGWLLGMEGGFDTIEVHLAGGRVEPAQLIERPDMAKLFPHIPRADRSGFLVRGKLPPLAPQDTFEFAVVGTRAGRPARQMLVGYHRPPSDKPLPPPQVMSRAAGAAIPDLWVATGIKGSNDVRRVLGRHVDLRQVKRLLEWGCGSGRVTRHLIDRLPWARVHGTDIDAEAVAWAAKNLDGEFVPCRTEPPLPYADATFDAIVSLSVFTHLTRPYQAAWLQELRRILVPGGLLLATTHGEFAGHWLFPRPDRFREVFANGIHDSIRDDTLGAVASGEYYRSTFQTRDYTQREWSKYMDVIDFVEGGSNNLQDMWVLRRPRGKA